MKRSHRAWTLLASLAGQTMAIGVAVLLPLIFPDSLSPVRLTGHLVEPSPPPPPPFDAVRIVEAVIERAAQTQIFAGRLFEPAAIPERPATIIDEPAPAPTPGSTFGVPGGIGVPGGFDGGVLHSLLAETVARAISLAPPPAQAVKEAAPPPLPTRIKVGGLVQQGKILHQPMPVYPPLARAARVQGTVRLEGILGKDGRVRELRVVSGHALLAPAAVEAVRRWIYKPTLLNGEAVEVVAPIDVNFTLN
ncbi:MAG: energy transducer TonB [Bryobacterales bacterium]|nr:energy transducer TonB [Bryobacterales bacterium]